MRFSLLFQEGDADRYDKKIMQNFTILSFLLIFVETNEKAPMKRKEPVINKTFIKDLFVLWFALAALVCAAINLHISLNMLGQKDKDEK